MTSCRCGPSCPGRRSPSGSLVAKTKVDLRTSTLRAYRCYLDLLADGYQSKDLTYPGIGDTMVHDVLASDLREALAFVKRRALRTAEKRGELRESVHRAVRESTGAGAQSNAVAAWRCAFKLAVDDRHLAKAFNPATDVEKPRRFSGKRRPLRSEHMKDFWAVVKGTGNDPELDELVCQTILITGARREGLINLNVRGIDRQECTRPVGREIRQDRQPARARLVR